VDDITSEGTNSTFVFGNGGQQSGRGFHIDPPTTPPKDLPINTEGGWKIENACVFFFLARVFDRGYYLYMIPSLLCLKPASMRSDDMSPGLPCLRCLDAIYSVNWLGKWTPERNAIGHTPARFKRAGVGTNGILECKLLPENAHHASYCFFCRNTEGN
jgi:hypothetical protein